MPTKLLTLLVLACSVLISRQDAYAQSVQKFTLSSFSTVNNDSVYVVAGQSMSGESLSPKVLHGYLPFQYSTLDVEVISVPTLEMMLWPNPASTTVQLSFSQDDTYETRIYSGDGSLKAVSLISGISGELDISNLASGLYFIKVLNSAGISHEQKLIKQ